VQRRASITLMFCEPDETMGVADRAATAKRSSVLGSREIVQDGRRITAAYASSSR
jgi:hypothetical protein